MSTVFLYWQLSWTLAFLVKTVVAYLVAGIANHLFKTLNKQSPLTFKIPSIGALPYPSTFFVYHRFVLANGYRLPWYFFYIWLTLSFMHVVLCTGYLRRVRPTA